MGSTTHLDPSFTIFQPHFWLWKRLECDTCTFVRVSFIWPALAIATILFSWFLFCHVEHCQLTTCSVWHESLPDHAKPCQNMWAPYYAVAQIGWNLRVCLLWLTGVELSILKVMPMSSFEYERVCVGSVHRQIQPSAGVTCLRCRIRRGNK